MTQHVTERTVGKMLCLVLLSSVLVLTETTLAEVVYVDGSASISAHIHCGNYSNPCPTLEAALQNSEDESRSITVYIVSSTLTLSDAIVLKKLASFELKGHSPEGGTLVTCSNTKSMSGLVIVEADNVTLSDVKFSGCGALWNYSRSYNGSYKYRAVVHLHMCKDVSITNVNASENHGTGIAIVDPLGGTMTISKSHFTSNRVPTQDVYRYHGGTGIYVRERGVGVEGDSNVIHVSGCTFEHNRPSFPGNYSFLNVFHRPHVGTGRGGGLDVILWNNASWNNVSVTHCVFRNNTAYLGGGLAIQLQYDTDHNYVNIEHCVFEQNGCVEGLRTGSGGGAHFGYSFYGRDEQQPLDNHFIIKNTTFRENCAEVGGGMTFYTSRSDSMQDTLSNTFVLDNCSWIGNTAHIGAAVDLSPHVIGRTQEGFLPTMVFKDCYFFNNHVAFRKLDLYQSFGSGALFSSLFNVDFLGFVHFEKNSGSAFIIVNAIANFSMCDATFVGNTGVQGGAISIIGVSALYIGSGRSYIFKDNHATDRGGAIYAYLIDDHDFAVSRSCFINYNEFNVPHSEWNASVYFFGNTAGAHGHSIFCSSILPCAINVPSEEETHGNYNEQNTSVIFRSPKVFHYDNRTENQIATEGGFFDATESSPFQVIPGEEHKLGIAISDDVGQPMETIFRASIINTSVSSVDVDDAFSCLSGNIIQLKGETGSSGVLLLETITSRKNSIAMNVTLLPCPPGFVLTGNECTCSIDTYSAIVGCDLKNFRANMKVGYWAGYIDNDTFVTAICPLAFCGYNNSHTDREVPLPKQSSPSHLDKYICGPTRTGILCGSCKPGYSVFYHSPSYSCRKSRYCEWGWLFYILSELLPVTLTFVAILALNISFTSGHINGFILFSQLLDPVVVNGSGIVQFPETISVLSWGYQLIYGIFTIEFFNIEPLSFCLWEGATVLDILAFHYVTIVYAFLLVLLTLLFLKYCGHKFVGKYLRMRTIKSSVIHGLSAFIVLCYAQSTKVSINILISGYLRGENGEVLKQARVFFNGDIATFSLEHLPYALPAIVCLMTISTIPPILLLLHPSVNKLLTFCMLADTKCVMKVSRMIPIYKLKPFLDSFQGSFRDNLRFFAGIYFLYRWIALLLFATIPSITGFYISLGIAYILILMIHTVFQPYERRTHNIIDGFLLANLALIYSIAGYNYLFSQGLIESYSAQNRFITTTASIQLILIYLPIVVVAMYAVIVLVQKTRPKRKRTSSEYTMVEPPRPTITSTVIDDILEGPEEFPARMLEAEYEQYNERRANKAEATIIDNPLYHDDDDVFVETRN